MARPLNPFMRYFTPWLTGGQCGNRRLIKTLKIGNLKIQQQLRQGVNRRRDCARDFDMRFCRATWSGRALRSGCSRKLFEIRLSTWLRCWTRIQLHADPGDWSGQRTCAAKKAHFR